MANSTLIKDYVGQGLFANRPATPPVASSALAFYYATDTTTAYLWDSNAAAWVVVGAGSGIGTIIPAGVSLTTSPVVLPSSVGRNVPAAAGFSFINQNSSTLSDNTNGPLVWSCPNAANTISGVGKNVPAGNWTYTSHDTMLMGHNCFNIALGITDGTKFSMIGMNFDSSDKMNLTAQYYSNFNTFVSAIGGTLGPCWISNPCWFRMSYVSSTNTITYYYSIDGFTWNTVGTSTNIVATQIFFGGKIVNNVAGTPQTVSKDYLVQT